MAARRLPELAESAMRDAVLSALVHARTPRALIDDALIRFERGVGREAPAGIRPSLLFAERDRVVRDLRAFIDSRLAVRLGTLRRRDIVAVGRGAAPYDAIVRNSRGRCYAIVLRRLPKDGRRLDVFQCYRRLPGSIKRTPLSGILIYDFSTGVAKLLLDDAGAQRVHSDLRAS
ncbi:MAG: hypothetical protein M3R51_10495 [Candidatus Eremiobacteraeota bacterium]|nr:hypothetical protein [Candidatus Eremiobacteraeota bacterium]